MKKTIPLIVIAVLVCALLLKSIRYLDAMPSDQELSIEHQLSTFMAHHGWSKKSVSGRRDQSLFNSLTYAKLRCDQAITIAVLSDNTELHKFVKNALGDDHTIFQDTEFSDKQHAFHLELVPAKIATLKFFANPGHVNLPPLAISPAPSEKETPCAPPSKEHWKNWFRKN